MKEHTQEPGVRKYAGQDLIELQAEPLRALQGFLEKYGSCVLNGCGVTKNGNTYSVETGFVALYGINKAGERVFKVASFNGAQNVNLPAYLVLDCSVDERVYADGVSKPIAYNYTARIASVKPSGDFLEIKEAGVPQFVDVIGITDKLSHTGDAKNTFITFADAVNRVNISSGDKTGVLFSKIKKWFSDLKALAFKDKVSLNDFDTSLTTSFNNKVDKVAGKALSTNDYTNAEKTKLQGIESNATANAAATVAPGGLVSGGVGAAGTSVNYARQDHTHSLPAYPASLPVSDVYSWAKQPDKPTYTASEVGLGNVPNVATNNQKPTFSQSTSRTNIVSGDTLTSILGKIMKWFADLKMVAFSGSYSDLSGKPSSLPASDVYSWAKQPNKPTYTASEVGAIDSNMVRHKYLERSSNTLVCWVVFTAEELGSLPTNGEYIATVKNTGVSDIYIIFGSNVWAYTNETRFSLPPNHYVEISFKNLDSDGGIRGIFLRSPVVKVM